jgi:organic radical activating enzyme
MHTNIKNYIEIRKIQNDNGIVGLYQQNNSYIIYRLANRGAVSNFVAEYELINDNQSTTMPMDIEHGNKILDRIAQGESFSDAFIFYKHKTSTFHMPESHSKLEDQYTSTGIKFWRHQEQMINYRDGNPNSVVSTHVSPEGACNLRCPYCSVTYRDTHSSIPLHIIQDYVTKLKTRGLKAVILTGGGEPTAYKQFNELVRWLNDEQLEIALVTNGSKQIWKRIDPDVCNMFTWIRVSINIYRGWESNIALPIEKINTDKTTIGCSMVWTVANEINADNLWRKQDPLELLRKVAAVADQCGARYIRMLPNCLLKQENLLQQHAILQELLSTIKDPRFFHQIKQHRRPTSSVCHQSYFRPYLSEEIHKGTGLPGTVYPCDSVVLNNSREFYAEEYQLCHASDILDYLDRKIKPGFAPNTHCEGCVHTNNIDMLDHWVNKNEDSFKDFPIPLVHENFI